MKKITPFLWFDDNAEAAAKFYVKTFKNSKILKVQHRPSAGKMPGPALSVTFRLDGQTFIALNGGPYYKLSPAISMYVSCKTQRETDALWQKLVKGGAPSRCGWLTDRFGLTWQIIPDVLPKLLYHKNPDVAGRAMQAMLTMEKIDIRKLVAAAGLK